MLTKKPAIQATVQPAKRVVGPLPETLASEKGKRTPKITAKESKFLLELFSAWQGLKNLGWQEPRYFRFPENGKEFELIELGSTGIHRAVRHGGNDQTCWIDYEWPSTPFLVREVKSGRAER